MLTSLTTGDLNAIHSRGLGLRKAPSRWDLLAEAWRSALWALCHPHWQAASSQRLSNLFFDLASPVVSTSDREEVEKVRSHLVSVGDLIQLPHGEWLPAPLKLVVFGTELDFRIIGGMPSWVMEEVYPGWYGKPGFLRTSQEGIPLHRIDLEEWCLRDAVEAAVPSLSETIARAEALNAIPWIPIPGDYEFKNRALANPNDPPVGAWVLVRDLRTHHPVGIAAKSRGGWSLRPLPQWMDGRMARLICQAQAGVYEHWQARVGKEGTLLKFFVQLPNWHWQVLLCGCLQPPEQDPVNHRWSAMISPPWLEPLKELVFSPLQMIRVETL